MTKNFPNLTRDINPKIQEAEWIPNRINSKKLWCKHIIIKFLKAKDKNSWKQPEKINDALSIG